MQTRIRCTLLIILAAFSFTSALLGQELVIRDGTRQITLRASVLEGDNYYRVVELASVLEFRIKESGSNLEIIGDRGSLTLIQDRPLVRTGSQYIMLSAPVVKLRSTGWWVPEDFLERLLPNILSRHLVVSGRGEYRVESLDENTVRVEAVDYPDHVSIVFRTSQQVSPRIREFREFIEIRFDQYVVRLEQMDTPDTFDVISSVSFDPNDGMGTFKVSKGKNFGRYSEYVLSDPPRVVIDFFEAPREIKPAEASSATEQDGPLSDPADTDDRAMPGMPDSREAGESVVVIDAGHGGSDFGVEAGIGIMEKNLTLAVALLLENRLEERGIKTRVTRNRDVSLSPEQRSSVGNFYATRAFVSLHVGGAPTPATQGPLVYYTRPPLPEPDRSAKAGGAGAARSAAQKGSTEAAPGGGNPDRAMMVPWDAGQNPWTEQSASLAGTLQNSLNSLFLSENRVLEAPLSVLTPVRAPAVLIEMGFLTNDLDREFLLTPGYQQELARMIADGIAAFLR